MRLIIADDAALLREGLQGLLERQGHDVLATAASAQELEVVVERAMTQEITPDVICTDVKMPPTMTTDGLDAALRIRNRHPRVGIMVLSQYVAPAYAGELFHPRGARPGGNDVGGLGYLLKERISRVADFIGSLQVVAAGGVVIDPEVASQLVMGQSSALDELTPRELEVLELMAQGLSNSQISERLFLSAGAVSKHVANVFTKLGLPPGEDNRRVRAVLRYLTEQHR